MVPFAGTLPPKSACFLAPKQVSSTPNAQPPIVSYNRTSEPYLQKTRPSSSLQLRECPARGVSIGVRYATLTNGETYVFYDRLEGFSWDSNIPREFRLTSLQAEDLTLIDRLRPQAFSNPDLHELFRHFSEFLPAIVKGQLRVYTKSMIMTQRRSSLHPLRPHEGPATHTSTR